MIKYDLSAVDSPANERLIKLAVKEFSRAADLGRNASFSLAFVNGPAIRRLNKSYRGKDKVTDVLSFAEKDSDLPDGIFGESSELGEILICVSRAKEQAKQYGWSYDREVCRLLVHGLAHLVGFEHEGVSERTAEKMFSFERKVMDKIFPDEAKGSRGSKSKKCAS